MTKIDKRELNFHAEVRLSSLIVGQT